jgi:hypothetical protein
MVTPEVGLRWHSFFRCCTCASLAVVRLEISCSDSMQRFCVWPGIGTWKLQLSRT